LLSEKTGSAKLRGKITLLLLASTTKINLLFLISGEF